MFGFCQALNIFSDVAFCEYWNLYQIELYAENHKELIDIKHITQVYWQKLLTSYYHVYQRIMYY